MIFSNKRGVSPLVATMLLIAFAIALGAVVINLGTTITVPEETGSVLNCDNVNLELTGDVCYNPSTKMIEIPVYNKESSVEIDGLEVGIQGESYYDEKYEKPIVVDRKERISIPYDRIRADTGQIEEIRITPFLVGETGEIETCYKKKIIDITINDC